MSCTNTAEDVIGLASQRDLLAARLHQQGVPYTELVQRLGFGDRRAAHRAVARGLAERAEEEALRRGLVRHDADQRLMAVQRRLSATLDNLPVDGTPARSRLILRLIDTALRVSHARCTLWDMYTHPYRYDLWWRSAPPAAVWWSRVEADQLGRDATIPPARPRAVDAKRVAPVVTLPVVTALPADVADLVPADVRRLLDAA